MKKYKYSYLNRWVGHPTMTIVEPRPTPDATHGLLEQVSPLYAYFELNGYCMKKIQVLKSQSMGRSSDYCRTTPYSWGHPWLTWAGFFSLCIFWTVRVLYEKIQVFISQSMGRSSSDYRRTTHYSWSNPWLTWTGFSSLCIFWTVRVLYEKNTSIHISIKGSVIRLL